MYDLERPEKFKTWLTKRGAVVLDPTNEYELVRFRTENGVSVVYTGKRGITFTGESEEAYEKFIQGKGWKTVSRRLKQLRAKKARLAARDGKRCFAHGEKMNFDDLTIEHLLSFSHGGSDHESNLALVCTPCGNKLGTLPITKKIELMQKLRREYVSQAIDTGKFKQEYPSTPEEADNV
jgi:hypothetical protein